MKKLLNLDKDLPKQFDFRKITPKMDIGKLHLKEACQQFAIDKDADLPIWIWLLESPESPIALPGSLDLYGHDCIHLLLNRGVSAYDEAFVIGFTMGNSDKVKPHHIAIIKTFSRFVYPNPFKFTLSHLQVFDLGFMYGKQVKYRNIYKENFDAYKNWTIEDLRIRCGISLGELQALWMAEEILFIE
jgi:hypothetical protein